MKKGMKNKKILIGLIIVATIVCWAGVVNAANPNLIKQGQSWIGSGSSTLRSDTMWANLKQVAQLLMAAAVAVFVSVGAVMGVKFMLQGPDQKARMKERLIWYIIAMVFVFGIVGIFNILVGVFGGIVGDGTGGAGGTGGGTVDPGPRASSYVEWIDIERM